MSMSKFTRPVRCITISTFAFVTIRVALRTTAPFYVSFSKLPFRYCYCDGWQFSSISIGMNITAKSLLTLEMGVRFQSMLQVSFRHPFCHYSILVVSIILARGLLAEYTTSLVCPTPITPCPICSRCRATMANSEQETRSSSKAYSTIRRNLRLTVKWLWREQRG